MAKFRKLPSFKYKDVLHGKTIGSEAFGTVKLGYIVVSMQQKVAIKSFCEKSSNQHILVDGLVYSEMSGNVNFPSFYGMIDNRCLIIKYFSSSETLKKQLYEQNYSVNWKDVCLGIVRATFSLHLKGIIHIDIHCNYILKRKRKYVKLIDFGKRTLAEDPVTDSLKPGSDKQKFYNNYHCHLVYELRHVPGLQVCMYIYSVGYVFGRVSNGWKIEVLTHISKQMLSNSPNERPELSDVLRHLMLKMN